MTRNSIAARLALATTAMLLCSALAVPAHAQRALTFAEAGAGVFESHRVSATPCPTSIVDGPSGSSVKVIVNCRLLPWSATYDFDLFKSIGVNPAWVVVGASVDSGTIRVAPSAGTTNPFTQVRLTASAFHVVTSVVTVTIGPNLPAPLPLCTTALNQTPLTFVCVNDADCPAIAQNSKPQRCSVECGNRCTD